MMSPEIPEPQRRLKPLFACFLWGRDYIDTFCELALPMQLSEDNIPAVIQKTDAKYVILTRSEDYEYLLNKDIILYLSSLLPFEALIFEENDIEDLTAAPLDAMAQSTKEKYGLISSLQSAGMNIARSEGFDCLFPLYSDVLCSNGSIGFTYDRLCDGHDAVVSLGPQAVLEEIKPKLTAVEHQRASNVLHISPRDLVKYTFSSLHPFHAPSFWERENFTTTPSMLFWRAPDKGVIAHGFHLHPVAFTIPESPLLLKPFHGTLDEHFMPTMFSSAEEVFVSQDSDDVFMCSVESLDLLAFRDASVSGNPNVAKVSRFAEGHSYALQRELVTFPILIHQNEVNEAEWEPYVKHAQNVVSRILMRLSASDSVLELEDKLAFDAREYHIGQIKLIETQQLSVDIESPLSVFRVNEEQRRLTETKLKDAKTKAALAGALEKAGKDAAIARESLTELSGKIKDPAEQRAIREVVEKLEAGSLEGAFEEAEKDAVIAREFLTEIDAGPTVRERLAYLYDGHYSVPLLFGHLALRTMLMIIPLSRIRLQELLTEDEVPSGQTLIQITLEKCFSPILKISRKHHHSYPELFKFKVNILVQHFVKRLVRVR